MLVLTRKLQEQIRIGNDIVITVLEFRGNAIKLGIDAPRDVRVMREELPRREITINLESKEVLTNDQSAASFKNTLASEPTANIQVQVVELGRNRPVRSSSSPLASKLSTRRAANMPNSIAPEQTVDPRPETDMFGQDHLAVAQKENFRSFSSAV